MMRSFLPHRVILQAVAVGTPDSTGAATETWTDIATIPARVDAVTASEQDNVMGKQIVLQETHRVNMRYRADVTAQNRLVWTGRYLYPFSVTPDLKLRWLTLLCGERP